MAYHNPVRQVRGRRALDAVLLGGVSALALMASTQAGEARSARDVLGSVTPTMAAQQAAAAAATQAAAAAAQAQSSLNRAAAALAAAQRAQASAAAAGTSSSVPDGLVAGGLVPTDPTYSTNQWIGADAPVQSTNGSQVTVDIQQTQQKAILYWNTFNVGANTTVNFQQQDSTWIALNRVNNSTSPSQILGHINAPGAVYLINSNGIIFGAGSQVNVNTLVASSLDLGPLGTPLTTRDSDFQGSGINNPNSFSFYDWATQGSATSNAVAGDIVVQRGARITANIAADTGSSGDIYLFGANVYNSGWLSAPAGDSGSPPGEIAMVAARTVDLVSNGYSNLTHFLGTEFKISQFATTYQGAGGYPNGAPYEPGTGTVYHDGLIQAPGGTVIMDGDNITVGNPRDAAGNSLTDAATGALVQGVISADTSIDRNSFVVLRAATSVTMNGVISSLPYDDGAEPLPVGGSGGSTVQSFTPAYIEMTAQNTVNVGGSGLISAPSASVMLRTTQPNGDTTNLLYALFNQGNNLPVQVDTSALAIPQTVLLSPGSVIDVAGLENVTLPASYNFISFDALSQFADMPLQRNGPLYGQTLWIDIRESGTRSDGTSWVGTPLLNASDNVNAVGRSIYQLMTTGGSVTMQTDQTGNGNSTVQTAGSVINVAGGSVDFQPGWVPTTLLLGADGRIYSMANADPNRVYVGIAQFSVDHSRWGLTETWSTLSYSPGYTEGYAAGSVSVTTDIPALQGTIFFGSVAGERQIDSGQLPSQGSLSLTTSSSVQIGPSPSADYITQSPVTELSADTLSDYGLSSLSITANDLVVSSGSTLNLAPGGSFSVLAGGAIDIAGTVSAAGGSVSLVTDRFTSTSTITGLFKAPTDQFGGVIAANVYVEGTIDVSGRFVNDTGRTPNDMTGPGDINGGTISIATDRSSFKYTPPNQTGQQQIDTTGGILLARSSLLDVSSGGYISPQGTAKTASADVLAGQAGNISLATYLAPAGTADYPWSTDSQKSGNANYLPSIRTPDSGILQLDGTLRGYGFQSNGSLTLSGADTIQIGGTLPSGTTSLISIGGVPAALPLSLFTGGGFGSYTIQSVPDGWTGATASVTVAAGVNLTLQQQNFSSTLDYTSVPTGTKLGQQTSPALATLPADQRKPVNLTLNANNILLAKGSSVVTDPAAKITLGNVTYNPNASTDSTPANSVTLLGSIIDHSGSVFINATGTQLGPQALVDLSGTFVASSTFGEQGGALTSGTYLPGGTFTVEAGAYSAYTDGTVAAGTFFAFDAYAAPSGSSYLVADSGAGVDVSGAAGLIQVAGPRGTTSSVWSWSDAGTVSADVAGFAWGGSFAAAGGRYVGADGNAYADPRANNGTIILGGNSINLSQDTAAFSSIVSNFQNGTGAAPNLLYVAANQLEAFDNVYLYAGNAEGGATRIFTDLNGNIYGYAPPNFAYGPQNNPLPYTFNIMGNVNLDVANRLHIAAGDIAPGSAGSVNAELTAPYIELTGGGGNSSAGSSALTISAQTIDVEGAAFSGFSQVNLISSGDLRLGTPKVADGYILPGNTLPNDLASFSGSLASAGNLLLSAQRIYPVSAVAFTIQTPGDVTFSAPAGSNTSIPLSAGGDINVIASTIEQGGNLFAPLGQITLGNTTTATSPIITQSVTLEPGSLTSVTLADTIVPYGATLEGDSWYYNASLNPLQQLPSKGVVLAGTDVSVAQGSTIDLRGGGDLQAMQWIPGKGGSRDTLTTTPSGQTVYALVPSADASVAAYDIQFVTSRSFDNGKTVTAGDTNPLVGTQITIAGGGGIPAGTYTLYPAHYATLPGAMRVVYYGSNLGNNIPSGFTLTDGTVLVTGNYTQSTAPGKQSAGQALFAVQTNAVWQTYSEYQFTSANSYFRKLSAKNGTTIPLPIDAGSLQAIALQSFNLNGSFLAQPGQDSGGNIGHGSELDISSPQMIDIVGDAQYASGDVPSGYVALDVTQLDNSGFESILIGGLRSISGSATLITPASAGILVDTGGQAFTAPEILLVATPATTTTPQSPIPAPVANTGNVTIAADSVIDTTGSVDQASGRNYYFGAAPGTALAQSVAMALGGTLDSSGTLITGATGTLSSAGSALQSYIQNTTGAMFVATNDATLNASGPTATPLTVQFASGGSATVAADAGKVVLYHGAGVTTKALTLQATASTEAIVIDTLDNHRDLHVGQLNLAARTIALGSTTPLNSFSLALYNQQFANVGALAVKALSGTITIYGDYNPGQGVTSLTLDAASLVQAGGSGDAAISTGGLVGGVGTIALLNSGTTAAPTSPAVSGQSTLSIDAPDIVLGSASLTSAQTILGYANVNLDAVDRVTIAGPGGLTLGTPSDAVNLSVTTPGILVAGASGANGSSYAIATRGSISIVDVSTQPDTAPRPADSPDVGGNLTLTAANIGVGTVIQAQAGTITLEATTGDVMLNPRAYLDVAGYATTLVDVTEYQAGGKVVLQSDNGNVNTDTLSVIDVAQPAGGLGYGGEIDVTALNGNATFQGLLFGSGGPGHGGTFSLNIQGKAGQSFDLNSLADQLLVGGFTGAINVETRSGNLDLAAGHALRAQSITLTADDTTWVPNDVSQQFGEVNIAGFLDARGYAGTTLDGVGEAGGQISIYAANSVTLASSSVINATTSHADQLGGNVTIGIGWGANGKIYLQQGAQIGVGGGTQGGLSGGTVTFIAPRDGNNGMKLAALSSVPDSKTGTFDELPTISGFTISGARSVIFDAYVAYDTTSSSYGINGASLGWYGIVDPAGWYNPDGSYATSGSWTNVTGLEISNILGGQFLQNDYFNSTMPVTLSNTAGGSGATFTNIQMGVSEFTPANNPGFGANQSNIPVAFPPPPAGGVTAQGYASTDANGVLTITITNPGSGYQIAPPYVWVGQGASAVMVDPKQGQFGAPTQSYLTIVSLQIGNLGSGYGPSTSSQPITASIGGADAVSSATITFTQALGSGEYQSSNNGGTVTFTPDQNNFIPFQSSGVFSPFSPTTQSQPGVATFIGNAPDRAFFTSTLAQLASCEFCLSSLTGQLLPLVSQLGANVVQVQPGVQLVNSSQNINSGNITVASNWDLASGTVGNLQTATNPTTNQSFQYFDPTSSYVSFDYRLLTPWGGLDAGDLVLRAAGNINVNASISDGFFQFGNYLDPGYVAWAESYIRTNRTFSNDYTYYLNGYAPGSSAPIAPYNGNANTISPSSQDLAAADLFPNSLNVCISACGTSSPNLIKVTAPSSWSYTLTSGADLASANPTARISLAGANAGNTGDIIVSNHSSYIQSVVTDAGTNVQSQVLVYLPTMVRTGTGDITVAAARDVVMQDTTAPGVIYAAGVNTPSLPDPGYTTNQIGSVVASNPDGFLEPQVLAYGNAGTSPGVLASGVLPYYGPPTAAAFPEMGGDVLVEAQRDIIGYNGSGNKVPQYYQPWLLADSTLTPAQSFAAGSSVSLFGAGVFAPSGSLIASQTAWWIQYSSFQQGFLSAGGNVTVVAGRDLTDVSVSLPTTGRVSGGLSAASTPVTHLYGSGNMVVRAGGNIFGGSFYEGSGSASISARGVIGQSGTVSTVSRYPSSPVQLPDVPLLAVDTGTIDMVSLGSLSVAGVVNPAALQTQQKSYANPLENQANGTTLGQNLFMDTYGPDSGVRLVAETSDLTISIAPTAIIADASSPIIAAPATYPASLEALALNGDLITTGIQLITAQGAKAPAPGIVLSPSDHGMFELLAQGSVNLTFGFPDNTLLLSDTPRPYISAGSSLIDTGFDPFQPNSGFDGPSPGALLAHADDAQAGIDATARIYAVTGSIKATGNYGNSLSNPSPFNTTGYDIIQINRPANIYAGKDITDLNVIIQNIHPDDVSTITAGGNITYTGYNNGGGVQVAGPGALVVQAEGDIGPFLPSNADIASQAQVQEGIASVGNASLTPVGDIYVKGGSVGIYDQTLFGPASRPRRNTQLTAAAGTSQGADVVVLFGIRSEPDYQAMINDYIDPNTAGSYLNADAIQAFLVRLGYQPTDQQSAQSIFQGQLSQAQQQAFTDQVNALQSFLSRIGKTPNSPQDAWAIFQQLPLALQHVFVDELFFGELKVVGVSNPPANSCGQVCQPAWDAIHTLFPSGNTGTSAELNLLHGTIQTRLGGNISILGPGGSMTVGSLSTEPNPNLKLRDLGILSLGGGGINTYTDGNVLVNSSRILTTQGGDIVMWSSYGDLDAGRGSTTIVSAPALQAVFDQNDYETMDPGGYVTGSGIGTLQASSTVAPSNVYLVAPNGTVDFGTAGVRASGQLVVVAPVVANQSNATFTSSNITPTINVAGLTSGTNTAGRSAKSADTATASGPPQREQASVFIVEVIGYGGGDSVTGSTDESGAQLQNETPAEGPESATGAKKKTSQPAP